MNKKNQSNMFYILVILNSNVTYLSAIILRRHGKIIATVWLKNISYMHNRYILFNYYWIWMHCLRAMQCKHEHFAPWTLCSFLHAFVCFDHYEREGSIICICVCNLVHWWNSVVCTFFDSFSLFNLRTLLMRKMEVK